MDDRRFDKLARMVGVAPRRAIFSAAGSTALAALLGGKTEIAAKRKKKRKRKKKKPTTCTAQCAGKNCGDSDGCGGFCSFCPPGKTCQDNQCVDDICTPDCEGKMCGDNDGCGGVCDGMGGCPPGTGCCPDGCVDLLNDDSNCLYCGYDCGIYEDGSCCCQGACMAPGSPYCECACCRVDEGD